MTDTFVLCQCSQLSDARSSGKASTLSLFSVQEKRSLCQQSTEHHTGQIHNITAFNTTDDDQSLMGRKSRNGLLLWVLIIFFLKRLSERRRRGPRFKVKRSTNVWVFLATHLGYYLLAAKHAVLFQLSHHKKRLHCQYQPEHHEIVHRQRSSFSCWLHTCIFQH